MCDAGTRSGLLDHVFQRLYRGGPPLARQRPGQGRKAAHVNLIRARHPEVRMMITSNAEANVPMLSINRRLGFAVHRREATYQLKL